MTEILGWMLGVGWKIAILMVGWYTLKYFVRNGTGTLKDLLETAGLAIRCACLNARKRLVARLKEEKEEPIIENGSAIDAEGSVR